MPESGHKTVAALKQGLVNLRHATAPKPVIVGEIGIQPDHPFTTTTMASSAVIAEQSFADRTGEFHHFGVLDNLIEARCSHFGQHRFALRVVGSIVKIFKQ